RAQRPNAPTGPAERTNWDSGHAPQVFGSTAASEPLRPNEHPVIPALRWAKAAVPRIESIQDYSCTFMQRERTDLELGPYKSLRLKVRQRPFSVYAYFDAPQDVHGQEVIYVAGQNGGNLLVHGVGLKGLVGTV